MKEHKHNLKEILSCEECMLTVAKNATEAQKNMTNNQDNLKEHDKRLLQAVRESVTKEVSKHSQGKCDERYHNECFELILKSLDILQDLKK